MSHRHILPTLAFLLLALTACEDEHEHTAPAIHSRDSVATMVTYGVNTLISDSGVIKYRIVTERWEVNDKKNPSRWIFDKGIVLTQFDLKKHVLGYITADTAYYFDKERRWELHGRVHIHTKDSIDFRGSELFWDEQNHEVWSHRYSRVVTPDREMEGNWFKSDERMTRYEIRQGKGSFERGDMGREKPQTIRPDSTHQQPGQPAGQNANTPNNANTPKAASGAKPTNTPKNFNAPKATVNKEASKK